MGTRLLIILAALVLSGCGNSEQKEAYYKALEFERSSYMAGRSYSAIGRYDKVIKMNPRSNWADKAQQRIDVIRQNINSDNIMREQRRTELMSIP